MCVYIHAPSGAQCLTFVEGLGKPDTTEWAPSKQDITVVCVRTVQYSRGSNRYLKKSVHYSTVEYSTVQYSTV